MNIIFVILHIRRIQQQENYLNILLHYGLTVKKEKLLLQEVSIIYPTIVLVKFQLLYLILKIPHKLTLQLKTDN